MPSNMAMNTSSMIVGYNSQLTQRTPSVKFGINNCFVKKKKKKKKDSNEIKITSCLLALISLKIKDTD